MYINGTIIYRKGFIEKETDAAKKNKYVDTLIWIYEQQMLHFGRTALTLERLGTDLLMFRQNKPEEANKVFKEIIESQKEKTSCISLMYYYQSLALMYKDKKTDVSTMIQEYFKVKEYLEKYTRAHPEDANCSTAANVIDKTAEPFLSCPEIEKNYNSKYTSLPADKTQRLEEMKKMLNIMNLKGCNDSEIYLKIAKEVNDAEPSHEGAYALGMALAGQKKYSEGLSYIKKAVDLCGDCDKNYDYLIGASKVALNSGATGTAASYARQALNKNPKSGEAYLIIAQAIAGTSCGDNAFQRRYVYWLAYDYCDKAASIDASVATDAANLKARYKANWPETRELFERSLKEGESITVGCWMNEATKIRAK
jgi:tetratricopeptide (TPR) repeat protein